MEEILMDFATNVLGASREELATLNSEQIAERYTSVNQATVARTRDEFANRASDSIFKEFQSKLSTAGLTSAEHVSLDSLIGELSNLKKVEPTKEVAPQVVSNFKDSIEYVELQKKYGEELKQRDTQINSLKEEFNSHAKALSLKSLLDVEIVKLGVSLPEQGFLRKQVDNEVMNRLKLIDKVEESSASKEYYKYNGEALLSDTYRQPLGFTDVVKHIFSDVFNFSSPTPVQGAVPERLVSQNTVGRTLEPKNTQELAGILSDPSLTQEQKTEATKHFRKLI